MSVPPVRVLAAAVPSAPIVTQDAETASTQNEVERLRRPTTELTKVVVHVEVAPAEPGGVGHRAEDRDAAAGRSSSAAR